MMNIVGPCAQHDVGLVCAEFANERGLSGKRKVESGKRLVGERYALSGLQIRSLRVSDTFSWSFRYVLSKAVQLCDRSLRIERLLVADERFIRPRCAYHPSETSIRSIRNYHPLHPKLAFAPSETSIRSVRDGRVQSQHLLA